MRGSYSHQQRREVRQRKAERRAIAAALRRATRAKTPADATPIPGRAPEGHVAGTGPTGGVAPADEAPDHMASHSGGLAGEAPRHDDATSFGAHGLGRVGSTYARATDP
jgi:hypothetical protein